MTVSLRPVNRLFLGGGDLQNVICAVFDNVFIDG